MANEVSLDMYKRAYREMTLEEEKMGVYVHLTVFVFVNAFLIFLNLTFSPAVLWFVFPLIGWGIGLTIHFLGVFYFGKSHLIEKEAKAEYRARIGEKGPYIG